MGLFLDVFKAYRSLDVTGHSNADADSIISTWLMGKVLKSVGVDSTLQYPLTGDESNADKKFIEELCEYLNIPLQEFIPMRKDVPTVCVDYIGNDKNVVAIIDHHKNSGFDISAPALVKTSSATAFLIYDQFKDCIHWTDEDLKAVAAAIILDTQYLNNERKLVKSDVDEMERLGIDISSLCKELMEMFIPFPDFDEINQHVKYEALKSSYVGIRNTPIMYKTMYIEMYFPSYSVDDAPIDKIIDIVETQRKPNQSVAFFFYDYVKKESLLIAKMYIPEHGVETFVQKFDSIVSRGDGLREYLESQFKILSIEELGKAIEEAEGHLLKTGLDSEAFAPMYLHAIIRNRGIQARFVANDNTQSYLQFPWGFVKYSKDNAGFKIIKKEGD